MGSEKSKTMTRIPSIWNCKTSNYGYLNLCIARQIQPSSNVDKGFCVLITWSNGQEQLIDNEEDAVTVTVSWYELTKILEQ